MDEKKNGEDKIIEEDKKKTKTEDAVKIVWHNLTKYVAINGRQHYEISDSLFVNDNMRKSNPKFFENLIMVLDDLDYIYGSHADKAKCGVIDRKTGKFVYQFFRTETRNPFLYPINEKYFIARENTTENIKDYIYDGLYATDGTPVIPRSNQYNLYATNQDGKILIEQIDHNGQVIKTYSLKDLDNIYRNNLAQTKQAEVKKQAEIEKTEMKAEPSQEQTVSDKKDKSKDALAILLYGFAVSSQYKKTESFEQFFEQVKNTLRTKDDFSAITKKDSARKIATQNREEIIAVLEKPNANVFDELLQLFTIGKGKDSPIKKLTLDIDSICGEHFPLSSKAKEVIKEAYNLAKENYKGVAKMTTHQTKINKQESFKDKKTKMEKESRLTADLNTADNYIDTDTDTDTDGDTTAANENVANETKPAPETEEVNADNAPVASEDKVEEKNEANEKTNASPTEEANKPTEGKKEEKKEKPEDKKEDKKEDKVETVDLSHLGKVLGISLFLFGFFTGFGGLLLMIIALGIGSQAWATKNLQEIGKNWGKLKFDNAGKVDLKNPAKLPEEQQRVREAIKMGLLSNEAGEKLVTELENLKLLKEDGFVKEKQKEIDVKLEKMNKLIKEQTSKVNKLKQKGKLVAAEKANTVKLNYEKMRDLLQKTSDEFTKTTNEFAKEIESYLNDTKEYANNLLESERLSHKPVVKQEEITLMNKQLETIKDGPEKEAKVQELEKLKKDHAESTENLKLLDATQVKLNNYLSKYPKDKVNEITKHAEISLSYLEDVYKNFNIEVTKLETTEKEKNKVQKKEQPIVEQVQ